jgi:hypothetical protein
MVKSYLEQDTKCIVEKTWNSCAECIWSSFRTGLQIYDSCNEYWPCDHTWRDDFTVYVLKNKSFKDHLKQLHSEWFLAGDCVLIQWTIRSTLWNHSASGSRRW